ncbi:MAG TPA: DUF2203 domain-containing protein [Gemmatimonadota bacterium]|jgi:hypothetical protein|nr:DUF2203 domain-containing protein [Gemmatimonadota bacterium]
MSHTLEQEIRLFSRDEAERMLPLVRSIVRGMMEDHAERQALLDRLDPGDEVARVRPEIDALTDRLVEGARELERLGAEFKGVELGLVDFPTLRDGQLAYLCWQYGEDRIRFWHSVETGYAGRRLLVED